MELLCSLAASDLNSKQCEHLPKGFQLRCDFGAVPGKKNDIAWQAVEYNGTVHNQLQKLKRVAAQMYKYHFSKYLGQEPHFKSKFD